MAREHFKTPLSLEYFDKTGLSSRIGGPQKDWHMIVIKELVDNGLDSAEGLKESFPQIEITVDENGTLSVRDNGDGIPASVINGTLDFSHKISSKDGYVLPSRGKWGHGLKFPFAVPLVCGAPENRVDIHSHGLKHEIRLEMNVNGTPKIYDPVTTESEFAKSGSFFEFHEFLKHVFKPEKNLYFLQI